MGGLLYDTTGNYITTCLLFSIYCLTSAILILFTKHSLRLTRR
ncbi:MAG: hypothetical protein QXH61_01085 [Candidatus Nezhaarchaeales archaeon]